MESSEKGVVVLEEHGNVVMESKIGAALVGESCAQNVNKENLENADILEMNGGISEDLFKVEESLRDSSSGAAEVHAPMVVATRGSKVSNPSSKKPGSGGLNDDLKNNKRVKDQANRKVHTTFSRTHRPSLSQTISFPTSRGILAANGSKNGESVKTNAKHTQPNGTETEIQFLPRIRQSLSGKSGLVSKSLIDPPRFKDSQSHDQNSKLMTKAPVKDDEDARSSGGYNAHEQRRISGFGFNFRLDERAEKRKEFFTKLEEKIHVKEAERTNLQAKTMESQEADIKEFRKSLTFKAAPMPIFYKEPPPKIELKKIPTTRAISPKLGRLKSSNTAAENFPKAGGSCQSPRRSLDHNMVTKGAHENRSGDSVALKKPLRKSLSKFSSQKSMKSSEKPLKSKTKTTEVENVNQDEEIQDKSLSSFEAEARTEPECYKNSAEKDETINLPGPQITCEEVDVKG